MENNDIKRFEKGCVEVAEERLASEMLTKLIQLEKENRQLKEDKEGLMRLLSRLSDGKTVNVTKEDLSGSVPEFKLDENIAGDLLFRSDRKDDIELLDFDRIYATRKPMTVNVPIEIESYRVKEVHKRVKSGEWRVEIRKKFAGRISNK